MKTGIKQQNEFDNVVLLNHNLYIILSTQHLIFVVRCQLADFMHN